MNDAGDGERPREERTWIERDRAGFYAVVAPVGPSREAGVFALDAIADALVTTPTSKATLEPPQCARLRAAILQANAQWMERATSNPSRHGLGATLAAILFHGDALAVGHLGDCRVYQMRGERFVRRTEDHTLAHAGHRHVVDRVFGASSNPEVVAWDVEDDDTFLLTGGVHEHVNDDELLDALRKHDPKRATEAILSLALARGGTDHLTALVVQPHRGTRRSG